MTTLQKHNEALVNQKYTGVVTEFTGYIQFGKISGRLDHDTIGFTADFIKQCIASIIDPNYLYSRQKNGYISIYGRDDSSPTGVMLIGGIPNELEYLLAAFKKISQLSPTEDMRTAH